MSNSDTSGGYGDAVSRRRYVALAGATGAAALAGCPGGGDGDGTEGTDGSDGSGGTDGGDGTADGGVGETQRFPDATHQGVTTANPANLQFNPTNSSNQAQIAHYLLFEQLAQYNYADAAYEPAGLSDWNFDGETFELTVREGLTWSDGEPVTAEDLVTQFRIAEADGASMWNWAESVEATGDRTVEITAGQDINPALVEEDVFEQGQGMIQQDAATYGDMLEGGTVEDVRSFEDAEPVTNGPFTLADRDEQVLLTERFEDHPDAENINFGQYAFNFLDGNQQRQQALLSLEVDSDFSVAAPARVVADFPDAVEEVRFPDVFGIGLTPAHDHPHAGDRAVRQAIAHVVDRDLVVQNSLPRAKKAPEIPTGVATDAQSEWLDGEMDPFESYGRDAQQTEEATTVLENAGYALEDGTWVDADGTVVSLPVTVPEGWNDWVLAAETAVQHMSEFGFDASIETTGDYFGDVQSDDFVLIANTWLHGGPTTYPYSSLLHQLWEPQLHAARYDYPGAMDAEAVGGDEAEITVPARDGDGETTVHPGDRIRDLAQATGESEAREIVLELAWVANQDLPMIPLAEKRLQSWLTNDEWTVPDDADEEPEANVQYPPTWLPRQGMMNYRG